MLTENHVLFPECCPTGDTAAGLHSVRWASPLLLVTAVSPLNCCCSDTAGPWSGLSCPIWGRTVVSPCSRQPLFCLSTSCHCHRYKEVYPGARGKLGGMPLRFQMSVSYRGFFVLFLSKSSLVLSFLFFLFLRFKALFIWEKGSVSGEQGWLKNSEETPHRMWSPMCRWILRPKMVSQAAIKSLMPSP